MRNPLAGLVLLLVITSLAFAQHEPKTHEECIKQVPGDWGPNFGDKWHNNEARYWACRNAVSVGTIKEWQAAAQEEEMATEIKPATVAGQEVVIFVEDSGTANCYGLTVLKQTGEAWTEAWELPSRKGDQEGYYCAGNCPGLEATINGEMLTVRSATSSDPNDNHCKHVRWESERFRWNGTTFVPLKSGLVSQSSNRVIFGISALISVLLGCTVLYRYKLKLAAREDFEQQANR
jgi:hypothetical protein